MSNVTVSDWSACYNKTDDTVVLSCTITTDDGSSTISGVGLILNNAKGVTLASFYTEFSDGNKSVTPALNMPPGRVGLGDDVSAVASGQAGGQHFFFQQNLTVGSC